MLAPVPTAMPGLIHMSLISTPGSSFLDLTSSSTSSTGLSTPNADETQTDLWVSKV